MSKRLQVLIEPKEYKCFQHLAFQSRLSLSEWVRQALRDFSSHYSKKSPQKKLKALKRVTQHQFPYGDMEQMLHEIESGYLSS